MWSLPEPRWRVASLLFTKPVKLQSASVLPRVPNRCGWLSLAQIATVDKSRLYNDSLAQIKAITEGEPNLIANLANIAAILKQNLGHYWVGFYLVDGENNELV